MNHLVHVAEDDRGPMTLQRAWLSDWEHATQAQIKMTRSSGFFPLNFPSVLKYNKEQCPE